MQCFGTTANCLECEKATNVVLLRENSLRLVATAMVNFCGSVEEAPRTSKKVLHSGRYKARI